MKKYFFLISLILFLVFIIIFTTNNCENFTTYQLNFSPELLPVSSRPTPANGGYQRCICSSDANCRCIGDDSELDLFDFPEYPITSVNPNNYLLY